MRVLLCSFLFLGTLLVTHAAIDVEIENKHVDRTIDVISQLVKISYKDNSGGEIQEEQSISTPFVVPERNAEHLASISAKDATKKELKLSDTKTKYGVSFRITLATPSANPVIYIETVFSKLLQPYPTQIAQSDKQLVRYFGNLYFYSPYKTLSQKTAVHLASRNIESYTQAKPISLADTILTYGPKGEVSRKLRPLTL